MEGCDKNVKKGKGATKLPNNMGSIYSEAFRQQWLKLRNTRDALEDLEAVGKIKLAMPAAKELVDDVNKDLTNLHGIPWGYIERADLSSDTDSQSNSPSPVDGSVQTLRRNSLRADQHDCSHKYPDRRSHSVYFSSIKANGRPSSPSSSAHSSAR